MQRRGFLVGLFASLLTFKTRSKAVPKLALADLQHLNTLDPSGRLLRMIEALQNGLNNTAAQVNASPVGTTEAPPQISAISVVPKGGGVHQVTIQDNNPVTRGINYFAEYSLDANFSTFTTVPMGPSRQLDVPAGTGNLNWRGYSQYQTSPPSVPVYHGVAVNSTGTTASAAAGIAGTGSGTEPSVQPQGGAGFGFNPDRSPRLPQ